jgi:hypothetical protein
MKVKTQAIASRAQFSECKRFRYTLVRDFRLGSGTINFIMLNPSTADEDFNDPTVGRCEKIAIANGFNQLIITNLFAYRATEPNDMKAAHRDGLDVTGGMENDQAIIQAATLADQVICAWGNHGSMDLRSSAVRHLLQPMSTKLHYLVLNRSGEPKHPLYVSTKQQPLAWGSP